MRCTKCVTREKNCANDIVTEISVCYYIDKCRYGCPIINANTREQI